jgi:MYXO-CTERM domain-containing protein
MHHLVPLLAFLITLVAFASTASADCYEPATSCVCNSAGPSTAVAEVTVTTNGGITFAVIEALHPADADTALQLGDEIELPGDPCSGTCSETPFLAHVRDDGEGGEELIAAVELDETGEGVSCRTDGYRSTLTIDKADAMVMMRAEDCEARAIDVGVDPPQECGACTMAPPSHRPSPASLAAVVVAAAFVTRRRRRR